MTVSAKRKYQWISQKISSNLDKIEDLYAYSRILRAELDVLEWKTTQHTSVSDLIYDLEH